MKSFVFVLLVTVMALACSRDKQNQSANDRTSTNVAADNSGRNARDRDGATKTAGNQSENEADRALTQKIRQAITSDDGLSTNGQNVKIITSDGKVTLRGRVKSAKEKADIAAKATQIAGVKQVDNQLEVTN
ncbi:MAG TPA: BON domain-containing protein [Opitutaceae bacterium]|nr:BON domain-containing protein [Opitutaceae bacterium]